MKLLHKNSTFNNLFFKKSMDLVKLGKNHKINVNVLIFFSRVSLILMISELRSIYFKDLLTKEVFYQSSLPSLD